MGVTIDNMGNFVYTNATTGTVYDDFTHKWINQAFKTEDLRIRNPHATGETSIQFLNSKNELAAYMFYHAGGEGTVGCYDAKGTRAIWRAKLNTKELTFPRSLLPEHNGTYVLGNSSMRWSTVYCTGVNQSSDINTKEDVQYLNENAKGGLNTSDFAEFVKNMNLATYKMKVHEESEQKEQATQLGFIAQDIKGSKVGDFLLEESEEGSLSYSLSSYVNILTGALQNALKRIEELEKK